MIGVWIVGDEDGIIYTQFASLKALEHIESYKIKRM